MNTIKEQIINKFAKDIGNQNNNLYIKVEEGSQETSKKALPKKKTTTLNDKKGDLSGAIQEMIDGYGQQPKLSQEQEREKKDMINEVLSRSSDVLSMMFRK